MMFAEALADFYCDEVVSDFSLQSATAFVAAIKGYSVSSIGKLLDRRRKAYVSDLFQDDGEFDLSVAKSRQHLRQAEDLVQRQYAARGYAFEAQNDPTPARAPTRASVILAHVDGRLAGTLTVGIDSPNGLFVDEANREFVDPLRVQGRRLGELVRLAVCEGVETDSRRILAALFNAAHGIMVANRLDDGLIEVNPRHVGFYRRAFCFKVAGPQRMCPRVGAPSVLLRMSVSDLTKKIGGLERAIADFPLS